MKSLRFSSAHFSPVVNGTSFAIRIKKEIKANDGKGGHRYK